MKITPAQRRALQIAERDVTIIFGGIDQTPDVTRSVVLRLAHMNLLRWRAPSGMHEESSWTLTDKGRAALAGGQHT